MLPRTLPLLLPLLLLALNWGGARSQPITNLGRPPRTGRSVAGAVLPLQPVQQDLRSAAPN